MISPQRKEYLKNYFQQMKLDPEKYEKYLQKKREHNMRYYYNNPNMKQKHKESLKRYWVKLKNDPKRYAEYKKKTYEYIKQRYIKDDKFRETRKKWSKEWYHNNKEKHHISCEAWRLKNADKHRSYVKASQQKMREQIKADKLQEKIENNKIKKFYSTLFILTMLSNVKLILPDCCYKPTKSHQFINPAWY